ncbi:EF-hand domain-containing protein [Falsigemmobacter intermedius]|uniref:EF-hand domain-containing protein n=1 Tax=Falsigemmobacter intermedius TaxID=1553448 RepID=UPI003620261B
MISKTLRPVAPALASVLALVLATGAVSAQDAGAAPAKRPAPLMQLDTDGDGRITRAEWDAPPP